MRNINLFFITVILCSLLLFFFTRRAYPAYLPSSLAVIAETSLGPAIVQENAVDRIMRMVDPPKTPTPVPLIVPTSSTAALSGLVMGAGAIAGVGFYARTGRDPVYAAASAIASAADAVFVPAYQAFAANFVSPESFPASVTQHIGKPASVGITVDNLVSSVESSPSSYPALSSLISSTRAEPTMNWSDLSSTTSFDTSRGPYRPLDTWVGSWGVQMLEYMSTFQNWTNIEQLTSDDTYFYFFRYVSVTSSELWRVKRAQVSPTDSRHYCNKIYVVSTVTSNPLVENPGSINHEALKDALSNPNPEQSGEIKEVVGQTPPESQLVSGEEAPTSIPNNGQEIINNSEVNQFFNSNVSNVANTTVNNISSSTTSNEIAKYEAAQKSAESTAKPDFPTSINAVGDAALPPTNDYDSEVEQPDELDFVDKVHSYINSGLPVISSIRASHLTASGSPRMSTTIWGNAVDIDFSGQQTVLRAAGAVLVTISLILSYLIIVRS